MSIHDKRKLPAAAVTLEVIEDEVPAVTVGRGGWTSVGKDNGSSRYRYMEGEALDGDQPTRDVNYQAVNFGVLQIQKRIKTIGFTKNIVFDGVLGRRTNEGIFWVQEFLGVTVDGMLGPQTARAMFRPYVVNKAKALELPPRHLWGIVNWESGCDPGAVGKVTPRDLGLCQFNRDHNPLMTVEDMFYMPTAVTTAAANMAAARVRFSEKGTELQDRCGIANHHAPGWARQWYEAGEPPNERILKYTNDVLEAGLQV